MRLLADENFPRPIVDLLRKEGHDVLWARTQCPGLKDRALLERAGAEDRLVVTLDKDFWQIALQRPDLLRNAGVVLFRVHPAVPENIESLVATMLHGQLELKGHISVVTKGGVETISPPRQSS